LLSCSHSTMAKKTVYGHPGRRSNPGRHCKASHPHASAASLDEMCATVEEMMASDTLEERVSKGNKAKASKSKQASAKSKKPTGKPTKEAPAADNHTYDSDDDQQNLEDADVSLTSPGSKGNNGRRYNGGRVKKGHDAKSVSSTDSDDERPHPDDDPEEIDDQNGESDNDRGKNKKGSGTMEANYKQRCDLLFTATRKKDNQIYDLTAEKNDLQVQLEQVMAENLRAKTVMSRLAQKHQIVVGKKQLKGKKRTSNDDDDDYNDDVDGEIDNDGDNDDGFVQILDKNMKDPSKRAVVTVFRTKKFISNNKQQAEFYEAVMDNLGKKELIVPPGASDQKKKEVAKARKKYVELYGKLWLHYHNEHRSYTQVSEQKFRIRTYPAKI
jgi:hypothetical protein